MILEILRSLWDKPAIPKATSPDEWGWLLVACF